MQHITQTVVHDKTHQCYPARLRDLGACHYMISTYLWTVLWPTMCRFYGATFIIVVEIFSAKKFKRDHYSNKQNTINVHNPNNAEKRMKAAPHASVLAQYLDSDGSIELTQNGSLIHL